MSDRTYKCVDIFCDFYGLVHIFKCIKSFEKFEFGMCENYMSRFEVLKMLNHWSNRNLVEYSFCLDPLHCHLIVFYLLGLYQ